MNVDDAIDRLADAGLLTERQAEAYVRREIELEPRSSIARDMDISPNTLDNTVAAARRKVEAAEATLETIDGLRHEDIPDVCEGCGTALGGRWTTDEDGQPLCIDCAGVDSQKLE